MLSASILKKEYSDENNEYLHFGITFSEAVTGVDVNQFILTKSNSLSTAVILSVSSIDSSNYIVKIDTGGKSGTISLGILGHDIKDLRGNAFSASDPGEFSAGSPATSLNGPVVTELVDVNADGRLDLVSSSGGNVVVALGDGAGNFAAPLDTNVTAAYSKFEFADLNDDRRLDLVSSSDQFTTVVAFGNGDGTFQTQASLNTPWTTSSYAVADYDNDGNSDIVIGYQDAKIGVLFGKGNGEFQPQQVFSIQSSSSQWLTSADINNDGYADIVTSDFANGTYTVLIGKGDGTFNQTGFSGSGGGVLGFRLVDVNHDGKLDIISANYGSQRVFAALGNGDGTFQPSIESEARGGAFQHGLAVGDLNGDGHVDIVTGNVAPIQGANVLYGDGQGSFKVEDVLPVDHGPYAVAIGDVNNDGTLDLVTSDYNDRSASVFLNGGPAITTSANYVVSGSDSVPCYCTGTAIRTRGAEIAIEALAIGDFVMTADGSFQPVRWIGRRRVDVESVADLSKVLPIRIAAGAFAPGIPYDDLFVSPDHAFLFDDMLVPAHSLSNGSSIRQTDLPDDQYIVYWSIELNKHDAIFANGVLAETYLDDGMRNRFDNYEGDGSDLDPARALVRAGSYRPLVAEGWRVGVIRQWLDLRAKHLGMPSHVTRSIDDVSRESHGSRSGPGNSLLQGSLDRVSRERIEGWGWFSDRPDEAVTLELLLDGQLMLTFNADVFRLDLLVH